jgi:CDP-paratose 2-epimerase
LRNLPLVQNGKRLEIPQNKKGSGWSSEGIETVFPLTGSRLLYGATKLCSEILIQEYGDLYGLPIVVNRCGVIAGPWQMGKVDQGFVTLWAARHFFGGELIYRGFGGHGFQVRDILHVDDLYELINLQHHEIENHKGNVFNVGGGNQRSVSLLELTQLCSELTGNSQFVKSSPQTHPADIPYYVTNNSEVTAYTGWKPRKSVEEIVKDIIDWLTEYHHEVKQDFSIILC